MNNKQDMKNTEGAKTGESSNFSGGSTTCTTQRYAAQHTTEGVQKEISFYIDRLPDPGFVDTYGYADHPKTWYTAAEKLGEIGAPAIPALV